MKSIRFIIALFAFSVLTSSYSFAQEFVGLWEIKEVKMGEELMTPQSKWTRIHADGSFESGNGWLQNSFGTWTFDQTDSIFIPFDSLSPEPNTNGFKMTIISPGEMKWTADEGGNTVEIKLMRIEALPFSNADLATGMWQVKQKEGDYWMEVGENLFLRWDRMVVHRNADGDRSFFFWHSHMHRDQLTFLYSGERKADRWELKFDGKEMTLKGSSSQNSGVTLTLIRDAN